eukprot:10246532-Alexandrium_andersonii.AAC.1
MKKLVDDRSSELSVHCSPIQPIVVHRMCKILFGWCRAAPQTSPDREGAGHTMDAGSTFAFVPKSNSFKHPVTSHTTLVWRCACVSWYRGHPDRVWLGGPCSG